MRRQISLQPAGIGHQSRQVSHAGPVAANQKQRSAGRCSGGAEKPVGSGRPPTAGGPISSESRR